MPDYTEEDVRQAERIVTGLLGERTEVPSIDGPLVVWDVETDAVDFNADLEILEMANAPCPALRVKEDLVPVALSLLFGPSLPWLTGRTRNPHRWRHHPFMHDWLYMLNDLSRDAFFETPFETMAREEARAAFVRGATVFLATRIAALRGEQPVAERWFGGTFVMLPRRISGPRIATPGCNFAVSTNSPGLRVFWSGAYRISPTFFGHPTTPTVGVLQSGTYVFGVDGGAYGKTVSWDTSAVISLPGSPHVHLNF
jgi:hypothetical protein